MPQPRTIAMEATIFTGWIYDHLLPHAEKVKVANPLMLRAIAAAKKKNDRIDAGKVADRVRCDFRPAASSPVWFAGVDSNRNHSRPGASERKLHAYGKSAPHPSETG
jgi:hypothetical protein